MKNLTYKQFALVGFLALTTAIVAVSFAITPVHANPEGFLRKQLTAATSSPTYMTAGTATTTLAFDTSAGNSFAPSKTAALLVQLTASSTSTTLRWRYEYSQDPLCGTTGSNADWYAQDSAAFDATATTSPLTYTQGAFEASWTYASTTPGAAAGSASANHGNKLVLVQVPTRCVRVMFYLPTGSTNGAVWAEWVAKKEVQ